MTEEPISQSGRLVSETGVSEQLDSLGVHQGGPAGISPGVWCYGGHLWAPQPPLSPVSAVCECLCPNVPFYKDTCHVG